MNLTFNGINIFYIILITFVSSLILVPFVRDIASHINAIDIPDKRKVHKKPMPRLGGLGIYAGCLLGYMIFGEQSIQMNAVLIGSIIIIITGIFDDLKPIPAKYKFFTNLLSTHLLIFRLN